MGDGDKSESADDWTIPCSDEEMVDDWEPSANDIIQLYEMLDKKKVLDLEWQCPGRRSPSVQANETDSVERSVDHNESSKPSEPNDFDFEDEITKTTKITPRRRLTPASNTKRVASLDKVMFDIERYRKLDELELRKSSPTPLKKSSESLGTSDKNS